MKLHFEPDLDYQKDAIESVAELFRGQEINRTEFTVTRREAEGIQRELGLIESELGIGNLYKDSEKTGGERPIDLIRATHPILIVDEPQSVDGGLSGAGKNALGEMNPLCTLRYSATHVDKHHMVYRLDAIDAYDRKLVKQIEVAALEVEEAHNKAYLRFVSAKNGKGPVTARIEIDVLEGKSVRRKEVVVQDGDDLQELTKRAVYADCRIGEIRAPKSGQLLEVKTPGGETFLEPGQATGDVDPDAMKRLMIRRTIHEHLEKESARPKMGKEIRYVGDRHLMTIGPNGSGKSRRVFPLGFWCWSWLPVGVCRLR